MQNNPNVASLNQKLNFVATLLDKMVLELNLKTFNLSMDGNHNKNAQDIRRFSGLTGFYQTFIKHYADKAAPLTRLVCKTKHFKHSLEGKKSRVGVGDSPWQRIFIFVMWLHHFVSVNVAYRGLKFVTIGQLWRCCTCKMRYKHIRWGREN